MRGDRIQKVLANLGFASRREIERWIADGRIEINGQTAELGQRITDKDRVFVDGKKVELSTASTQTRVLLYNKPEGRICTRDDPEGRPTIFEDLPGIKNARWINIGRLDINTSGLILFTNDGELANKLMHPSTIVEREYAVRVFGEVTEQVLKNLTHGVELEDGFARFEHIVDSGGDGINHWYHVVTMEGRNRVVRRLWETQDCKVSRLKRVRFGPIFLDSSVRLGQYRELKGTTLQKLIDFANR